MNRKNLGSALLGGVAVLLLLNLLSPTASAYQVGWRIWDQHAVETSLQVSTQGFADTVAVFQAGSNLDISSSTDEDIWAVGGDYIWPVAAETVTIVSDSADDDGSPAGVGAHNIVIEGLDADWLPQTETVTLDGLTPVTTVNTFIRVNDANVVTAGSDQGSNVGIINAEQTTTTTTKLFTIGAQNGAMTFSGYSVAADSQFLIVRTWASIGKQTATQATISIKVRNFGGAFLTVGFAGLNTQGSTIISAVLPLLDSMPPKSDIILRGSVSGNGVDLNAGFDGYLISNQ